MSQLEIQKRQGVDPTSVSALDPRQEIFIEYYLNTTSPFFANCFQSAVKAGYTVETARNFMHNRPKWYSEIIGQMQGVQPEHLLLKLTDIINSPMESTQNKLKAIDMLMKHNGMYQISKTLHLNTINIQSVLD